MRERLFDRPRSANVTFKSVYSRLSEYVFFRSPLVAPQFSSSPTARALENTQHLKIFPPTAQPTPKVCVPSFPPSCVCSAPWEYVLGAGIGAYVGNKIPQWEAAMIEDINEMRADRNMPPATRVGGYEFGTSMTDSKSD